MLLNTSLAQVNIFVPRIKLGLYIDEVGFHLEAAGKNRVIAFEYAEELPLSKVNYPYRGPESSPSLLQQSKPCSQRGGQDRHRAYLLTSSLFSGSKALEEHKWMNKDDSSSARCSLSLCMRQEQSTLASKPGRNGRHIYKYTHTSRESQEPQLCIPGGLTTGIH